MKNISAIFLKQITDTLKNKSVLIQFLMFPVMVIIMENAVTIENMPEHFFVKLFAVMFIGMAPLTCMSSIISEEKEKGTLRALMMSNVSPAQYLLGTGLYVTLLCMAGSAAFAVCGGYTGRDFAVFMGIMAIGIILSELTGAIIGICCRSQMSATSVAVPAMMVFSFLPMLSMFNESIEKFAKIAYSQQLSYLIGRISGSDINGENIIILAVNAVIAVVVFVFSFSKKGLE